MNKYIVALVTITLAFSLTSCSKQAPESEKVDTASVEEISETNNTAFVEETSETNNTDAYDEEQPELESTPIPKFTRGKLYHSDTNRSGLVFDYPSNLVTKRFPEDYPDFDEREQEKRDTSISFYEAGSSDLSNENAWLTFYNNVVGFDGEYGTPATVTEFMTHYGITCKRIISEEDEVVRFKVPHLYCAAGINRNAPGFDEEIVEEILMSVSVEKNPNVLE